MALRYAFDLGTNSIGWAVYRLERNRPVELVNCGVRLFSDGRNPKDGQSLAVMRRGPRSVRKRRDRFLQRRGWLMDLLVRHGLMPRDEASRKALEGLDPYDIRGRALNERLEPHEIGRALFHLNQRRGFKSNRVADAKEGDDKENGKIAEGARRLKAKLNEGGWKTLGQYYASFPAGPKRKVRVRMSGDGIQAAYEFYPVRELLETEFDAIWATQAPHHPDLMTQAACETIRQAIFHQRPLKPQKVGRCTFNPDEERLASAHPLAQAFRIYQELANIEIEEGIARARKLTLAERDTLAERLLAGEKLSFGKVRKALDIGGATRINLEEGGRDHLKGDECAARLSGKRGLPRLWPHLTAERRAEVIARLLDEPDIGNLKDWLVGTVGATAAEAEAAAGFRPPDGHIRLGPTATAAIVAQLKLGDPDRGITIPYSEAARRAGFHHSDLRTGEVFDALPDYREVLARHTIGGTGDPKDGRDKQLGRVPNPTVHIGLNQLRRVINALIASHGHPEQIVLELARELKQTKEQKDDAQKANRKNEEANRRRTADLEAAGLATSSANMRLLRLWEDLGALPRLCTYTGRPISFADVFSGEVEVEHILPFSRTLDDSMANKTLAFREANRGKRNMAPEEAWSGAVFDAIQQRANALPRNKAWRFRAGAMERFQIEDRDFLARQLNETRHLSRLAKEYVGKVVGDDNVWVVTGQLTALLRQRWGLNFSNTKDRNNHRHHAIDAATIGVIDRNILQELARRAGLRADEDMLSEITRDVPEPYASFRENVRARVGVLIVSHKPEHGTGGALHEDTAYGLVDPSRGEDGNLVYRKPLEDLKGAEIGRVRDLNLRARLLSLLEEAGGKKADDKVLKAALRTFGASNRIGRVRLLKSEDGVIVVNDRAGEPYKALIPGENHHMDIVEGPDGLWRGFAATVFDVNQKPFTPRWTADLPGAKLVMRLHKGDIVELADEDGARRIKRVVRISPSNNLVYLARHDEAGELAKRHDDKDDPFRWDFANIGKLKGRACVRAQVDEIGKINSQA